LPTVDGCASSPFASYTLSGTPTSEVSLRLTHSNSFNTATTGQSLTLNKQSDGNNSRVADGHLTSVDGYRLVSATAAASLPNHSSLYRESSATCRPTSISFVSTPGLKLAVSAQLNHKDSVSRYVGEYFSLLAY